MKTFTLREWLMKTFTLREFNYKFLILITKKTFSFSN